MTQTNETQRQDNDVAPEGETTQAEANGADVNGAEATESAGPASEEAVQEEAVAEVSPEQRIADLEAEITRLKTDYLRALADAQNVKRMADKRVEDNSKYAVSNFAKELLPVADNLNRALLAAPAEAREKNEVLNTLAVGVEMTEKALQTALEKYGVRKVDSLNKPFDPHFHQAVQEVEKTDVPSGTVVQVYQDGYIIQDRLLRPAMTVVSRGGPKRDAAANGDGKPEGQGSLDQSV
jgi:molecular chaperone GrpE